MRAAEPQQRRREDGRARVGRRVGGGQRVEVQRAAMPGGRRQRGPSNAGAPSAINFTLNEGDLTQAEFEMWAASPSGRINSMAYSPVSASGNGGEFTFAPMD